MHRGRPHFDPTQDLPEEGWNSFQGIPHQYPTEGEPLQLSMEYGAGPGPGPYQQGYVYPERAPEEDPSLWQSMRRAVEPESGAEMAGLVGASIAPGLGEAIDVVDFIAGVQDADWSRSAWAAGGLLLPFVAGSTLRKVGPEIFDKAQGFSQKYLRKNYPTPAPGAPKVGARGNEYLERGIDEPNELFHARRTEIQADIDAGNYEPHFDEAQRYYADEGLITGPTRVPDPARPATKQKWLDKYGTPETRARLNAAYDAAIESGDAVDWYAMGQLQDEAIEILGKEEGAEWFARKFADQMAATTAKADPTKNLIKASYGNWLRRQGATGIPLDELGGVSRVPKPVEGMLAGPLKEGFQVAEAGGLAPATQAKGFSFSQNFQGNLDPGTVDEQMMRLFDPGGKSAPPNTGYSAASDVLAEEAAKRGVRTSQFQDVAWAGVKESEGMPMIRHVNEALERTSRLTGQTTKQVLRNWIKNDAPLFAMAGLLGTGMVRSQNRDNYVER